MPEVTLGLAVASFIAGVLMFLAPCTLPLVPAYLAFISGVKQSEADNGDAKRKIITNGLAFIVGFTIVFTAFGVLAGFFGGFIGPFRGILTQIGGAFVILFGLLMLDVIKIKALQADYKFNLPSSITPGHPGSAALIGSIFALGWTPCVGPVLASVLLLATTSSTAFSGGVLLLIFSFGLAIPFLLTSLLYAKASNTIKEYSYISTWVNRVGGVFLVIIGLLLLTSNFGLMVQYGQAFFNSAGLEILFDHF